MQAMRVRFASTALAALLATTATGCSILIGNVKPSSEKAEGYGVMDLTRQTPPWVLVKTEEEADPDGATEGDTSDVAYQSPKTASIISLNSSCGVDAGDERDLRAITNLVLLGITGTAGRDERKIKAAGLPALQTTVKGKLNGETMMLRTVVLRNDSCSYDLMYVARPRHFASEEAVFSSFVSSLRLQ